LNKISIKVIILLLIPFIVACAPSASQIQTAVAQTQAAIPTPTPEPTETPIPTPTSIPLSEMNLEPILLVSGDLPPEFYGVQVKSVPPRGFEGIPPADQVIQQGFRAGAYAADGITIALYKSPSDVDTAYSTVNNVLEKKDKALQPLSDVGEKATIADADVWGIDSTQIVFTRCHALVYIDLFATTAGPEVATTYAQRLDKRLKPSVCP